MNGADNTKPQSMTLNQVLFAWIGTISSCPSRDVRYPKPPVWIVQSSDDAKVLSVTPWNLFCSYQACKKGFNPAGVTLKEQVGFFSGVMVPFALVRVGRSDRYTVPSRRSRALAASADGKLMDK